jgi:hypothetical protein
MASIERTMPVLDERGVRYVYVHEGCERLVTTRGHFEEGCDDLRDDPSLGEERPIDAQARADLTPVAEANGDERPVIDAQVTYGPAGRIIGGTFNVEFGVEYVYDPSVTVLPESDSELIERVKDGWYSVSCC